MNLKIFAMFDKKAQAFAQPFFFHHKAEALRALEDITTDPQSRINKHPADFSMHLIGEWDDRSGKITPLANPEFLEEALAFAPVKIKTAPVLTEVAANGRQN